MTRSIRDVGADLQRYEISKRGRTGFLGMCWPKRTEQEKSNGLPLFSQTTLDLQKGLPACESGHPVLPILDQWMVLKVDPEIRTKV